MSGSAAGPTVFPPLRGLKNNKSNLPPSGRQCTFSLIIFNLALININTREIKFIEASACIEICKNR